MALRVLFSMWRLGIELDPCSAGAIMANFSEIISGGA
jgi:hypothetical protein